MFTIVKGYCHAKRKLTALQEQDVDKEEENENIDENEDLDDVYKKQEKKNKDNEENENEDLDQAHEKSDEEDTEQEKNVGERMENHGERIENDIGKKATIAKKTCVGGMFGVLPCAMSTQKEGSSRKRRAANAYEYCLPDCNESNDGEMIECSGTKCPGKNWYHINCIEMVKKPRKNKKWHCSYCA